MYKLFLIKRWIEDLLMFPLILAGKVIGRFIPLGKEYKTFYFFPFYHIGGAEKVHAQIAKATGDKDCIIFFTRKSGNNLFYEEFRQSGCEVRDISKYTDNKWIYFVNIIFRGIISYYINNQKNRPLVFNGQCNFGYKISPWIRKSIPQVELIHSLCSFSYIRIPFLPFITRTVMISVIRIREHMDLYKRFGIPEKLGERIRFIMNGIDLPPARTERTISEKPLTVLYAGRATAEKRVHLIAEMARQMIEKDELIKFDFLGEVRESIPEDLHQYAHFWGNQNDPRVIQNIYRHADVLILASDTEGFPMVVMEAMAMGLAIVSTAVGELPLHVHNGVNGYLVQDFTDDQQVVEQSIRYISTLNHNRPLLQEMAMQNMDYAYAHFGVDRFASEYNELFEEMRNKKSGS